MSVPQGLNADIDDVLPSAWIIHLIEWAGRQINGDGPSRNFGRRNGRHVGPINKTVRYGEPLIHLFPYTVL